ncbi:MAG: AAA family ATPase [Fimbriiglobus sp.]
MEAVIFMGIQAAGKSSFYRERFFRTHMRINLDMLRSRFREKAFLDCCLQTQMKFVVDNTNPTRDDRARYIVPAKAAKYRIIGYYFTATLEECQVRNAARQGKDCIPFVGLASVAKVFEKPSLGEGFDELFAVSLAPDIGFQVQEWSDEV